MSHIVKPAGDIRYQDRFYYSGKLYACCFLFKFCVCVCVCAFFLVCLHFDYIYIFGIGRTVPALGKSSHLARSVSPVGRTTLEIKLYVTYMLCYISIICCMIRSQI